VPRARVSALRPASLPEGGGRKGVEGRRERRASSSRGGLLS
jgi:hypothetical protein